MLKPFTVNGHRIDGDLLAAARENNLKEQTIRRRVQNGLWSIDRACRTPKMSDEDKKAARRRYARKIESRNPVKVYYLPLEEVWAKYGKPGEIKYPERQRKEPIVW